MDSNTRRDTCCFVQASTTLRVAVVTAPRRFLGSSEGPTLDASTTASTSARASVSPLTGDQIDPTRPGHLHDVDVPGLEALHDPRAGRARGTHDCDLH